MASKFGFLPLTLALSMVMAAAAPVLAQDRGYVRKSDQAPQFDQRRTALVIGNGGYRVGKLRNPSGDAKLVAASLRSVGFSVDERHDLDRDEMVRAIRSFGNELKRGGVGVFYYAGHGMQVDGRSYLIPIGADISIESDVGLEGVDAGRVLARMEEASNKLNLVVLDACRNNPTARRWRSSAGGLAFLDAPSGTLIAYATAPGRTAADGAGNHSVYSLAFAEEMRRPGLRVEDVFKRVRKRVRKATRGKQVPWESSSLEGDFFFLPADAKAAAMPGSETPSPDQWKGTGASEDPPPSPMPEGIVASANDNTDDVYDRDSPDDADDTDPNDIYSLGTAAEEEMTDKQLAALERQEQDDREASIQYSRLKNDLSWQEGRQSIAGWGSLALVSTAIVSCGASIGLCATAFALNSSVTNPANQNLANPSYLGWCGSLLLSPACLVLTLPTGLSGLACGSWWYWEGENVEETTVELVRLDPEWGREEEEETEPSEAQAY